MNIWHNVEEKRICEDDFLAVIEIPKGSKTKYELDKQTGVIILDRVLSTSTQYPCNYGFIPKTLSGDGDPLDVLVLCTETLQPLSMVRCYPIGVVTMLDNNKTDEKIIAVPFNDPFYNGYKNIEELPKHLSDEIVHFFNIYKALENSTTVVDNMQGKNKAKQIIKESKELYHKNFEK